MISLLILCATIVSLFLLLLLIFAIEDKKFEKEWAKPEYQRQGYGKQFMELLIALYHVDTLIVAQNNYPAYFLYKKCGFEIVSGYYAPDLNTDVYCMKRKELNENV